jgi:hypothetical protein
VPVSLGHAIQALGQVTHAPGQPVRGGAGPVIRLPGRVAVPAGLRAALAGRIKDPLGSAEPVLGGVEGAFGLLHRGQGSGERILGCGQPAPQPGQLPDRLTAFPRPVCHLTIVAGSQAPAIARRALRPARAGVSCPAPATASAQLASADTCDSVNQLPCTM